MVNVADYNYSTSTVGAVWKTSLKIRRGSTCRISPYDVCRLYPNQLTELPVSVPVAAYFPLPVFVGQNYARNRHAVFCREPQTEVCDTRERDDAK